MASFPTAAYRSETLLAKQKRTGLMNTAKRTSWGRLTVCETSDQAAGWERLVVDIAVVHALLSHVPGEHPTILRRKWMMVTTNAAQKADDRKL